MEAKLDGGWAGDVLAVCASSGDCICVGSLAVGRMGGGIMKVILNHFHVQCGACGSGLQGQQAWLEAPNIIVECVNPNCAEYGKRYKLPINKLELEPFEMPEESENV